MADFKKNPYARKTPEDLEKERRAKQELRDRIENTAKLASECFADPKFIKYKEQYLDLRRDAFEKLKEPMDSDPVKDAHFLRACINSLLIMNIMLDEIQDDLKKGAGL